jgi:hypothetical protein
MLKTHRDYLEQRKPDVLQWRHVPVVCDVFEKQEEHQAWHVGQVRAAVENISNARPDVLATIPQTGFYILALRGQSQNLDDQPRLISTIIICEDTDDIESRTVTMKIASGCDYAPISEWGASRNPYIQLLNQLADDLPRGWREWLKWRRLRRWKPVPLWLVAIRNERPRRSAGPPPPPSDK